MIIDARRCHWQTCALALMLLGVSNYLLSSGPFKVSVFKTSISFSSSLKPLCAFASSPRQSLSRRKPQTIAEQDLIEVWSNPRVWVDNILPSHWMDVSATQTILSRIEVSLGNLDRLISVVDELRQLVDFQSQAMLQHVVGIWLMDRAAARKEKPNKYLVRLLSSRCAMHTYHGAIWHWLVLRRDTTFRSHDAFWAATNMVCTAKLPRFILFQCRHGVGHAVMLQTVIAFYPSLVYSASSVVPPHSPIIITSAMHIHAAGYCEQAPSSGPSQEAFHGLASDAAAECADGLYHALFKYLHFIDSETWHSPCTKVFGTIAHRCFKYLLTEGVALQRSSFALDSWKHAFRLYACLGFPREDHINACVFGLSAHLFQVYDVFALLHESEATAERRFNKTCTAYGASGQFVNLVTDSFEAQSMLYPRKLTLLNWCSKFLSPSAVGNSRDAPRLFACIDGMAYTLTETVIAPPPRYIWPGGKEIYQELCEQLRTPWLTWHNASLYRDAWHRCLIGLKLISTREEEASIYAGDDFATRL